MTLSDALNEILCLVRYSECLSYFRMNAIHIEHLSLSISVFYHVVVSLLNDGSRVIPGRKGLFLCVLFQQHQVWIPQAQVYIVSVVQCCFGCPRSSQSHTVQELFQFISSGVL